jgi:hypothetical protein
VSPRRLEWIRVVLALSCAADPSDQGPMVQICARMRAVSFYITLVDDEADELLTRAGFPTVPKPPWLLGWVKCN